MKVIVSVQAKRASSRGLVHYIAHSKTDAEREASGRDIFTEHADRCAVEKANQFLKNGTARGRAANEDLHHLVISLRAQDYDRLGKDEKERQQSFKEVTRHTLKRLEESVGANRLAWAAGVHRNTDNPHVHIAIQKEFFDKNLERKTLSKIPAALLPHYEKNGEEKTFAPGILIDAASEKLDEILSAKEKQRQSSAQTLEQRESQTHSTKTVKDKKQNQLRDEKRSDAEREIEIKNERDHLARAVLAKFYLEKTRENLESLENHGDKRRFTIYDALTGKSRKMSLFDLERRAEKNAARSKEVLKVTDATKRDELKKNLIEAELRENADGIKRIKTILHNLIVKENQNLRKRESDYQKSKPLAEKVKENCRRENRKLPVPNLSREELEMLQAASLEKRDVRAANYFERVRAELARERGEPTRTGDGIRRLKALRIVSELKVDFGEKQLKDLETRKRVLPVEIDNKKWSLAKADSLIETAREKEQKIFGKITKVLGKVGLIEENKTVVDLEKIKETIARKLVAKSEEMSRELNAEKSILKTLNEFYERDTNPEKETLEPKFTAAELAEVESCAFELKRADVYEENWRLQKQFVEKADDKSRNETLSINETKDKIMMGRAIAREVLCETELSRAKEKYKLFKKHKDFHKFEIENKKTGETKFVSLLEVKFDSRGSIFDQTLEYFTENRDKRRTRHEIEKQIKIKRLELKENLVGAKSLLRAAHDAAREYQTKSFFGSVKFVQPPLFTPKELMTIELRIKDTLQKSEAAKLQKILDVADYDKSKNLSEILSGFSAQKEHPESVERSSPRAQSEDVSFAKNEIKAKANKTRVQESKIELDHPAAQMDKGENHNQERGR